MPEHILIDLDGNSYNVELFIKHNKLFAIWDGEETEINLEEVEMTIIDKL